MAGKASVRKTATTKPVGRKTGSKDSGGRGDPGASAAAAYFAAQPADKRALLDRLRVLVMKGVPDATVSIKWGVPVYARDGKNFCALAVFKEHVGINFFASPNVLADPAHRLEGAGTTSRMLKVRTAGDIDAGSVLRWVKAAAGE